MATLCPIILNSHFSSAVHWKIVSLRDWEFPSTEFIHTSINVYRKCTLIFMAFISKAEVNLSGDKDLKQAVKL